MTAPTALNWYVTLTQELEIAGQRGTRLAVVDAEALAQLRRVAVAEQETAATALTAHAEVLAAREELELAARAAEVAAALGRFATARAGQDLLPAIESDLAQAEVARLSLLQAEAQARSSAAQTMWSLLVAAGEGSAVDSPPASSVATAPAASAETLHSMSSARAAGRLDDILPLTPQAEVPTLAQRLPRALQLRADFVAAQHEQVLRRAQVTLLRRARIPNVTLSFMAQNDGFNERVLGAGISLPLPLPEPLGPTRAGDIGAADRAVDQAAAQIEKLRRQVQSELERAIAAVETTRRALQQVPTDLIGRANADLGAIAAALTQGRLPLREALMWQRGLIDLLQLHVRARRNHALARIELQRASGLPLLRVQP